MEKPYHLKPSLVDPDIKWVSLTPVGLSLGSITFDGAGWRCTSDGYGEPGNKDEEHVGLTSEAAAVRRLFAIYVKFLRRQERETKAAISAIDEYAMSQPAN